MTITVDNYLTNVIQSLYYFLNQGTYTKGVTTQTLKQHFSDPQLDIILGFPPSLTELVLPTIALVSQPIGPKKTTTFREQYEELIYPFNLYGFCGGEQSYESNQRQRDNLANDLFTLLQETEYIDIYSVSDPPVVANFVTASTDAEVLDVKSRNLPPTGVHVADRYRFLIEFSIGYTRSIKTG